MLRNAHYENIPSNWAIARFSDIAILLSGRDLPNDSCNDNSNGIPYLIGASNIVNKTIEITRWTETPLVISRKGDILISCKGTIGEIVINDIGEIHIARQFMAVRPHQEAVLADYLQLCLMALIEEIKKSARGVIPGISRDDILEKELPIPPIREQRQIVKRIQELYEILDDISANL